MSKSIDESKKAGIIDIVVSHYYFIYIYWSSHEYIRDRQAGSRVPHHCFTCPERPPKRFRKDPPAGGEHCARVSFFPDAAARNLVGKQSKVFGLFIVDLAAVQDEYTISRSQFFYDYIAFAIDIANRHGYNLMITILHEENMSDIDRLFQSRSIAGGILMGDHVDQAILARLAAHEYKLVLYNQTRRSPAPNIITVNYDNFKCGRLAGEALVDQGHRRIGLITGEINKITVQDRLDGFETALTSAGIPFDREKYLEHGAFNRRSGGYDATMTLLQRNKDDLPTALCAASASMLMGAFAAIRDYGLRVPEDISLIGIDEVDMAVYTTPPLSIVATSCEAAAKRRYSVSLSWWSRARRLRATTSSLTWICTSARASARSRTNAPKQRKG